MKTTRFPNQSHFFLLPVLFLGMVLVLNLVHKTAFAQENTQATIPLSSPEIEEETEESDQGVTEIPGTVSCFDYYAFGSVQTDFSPSVAGTVSGTPITFSGSIKNNNPYPVVDGALYVKVFRSRDGLKDGNGPDLVDAFFVATNITIPAQGSAPASFTWNVPSYARAGEYRIATFFTTSRKFNLLGLSFTDDVVGNTSSFSVRSDIHENVSFDKQNVTVNGRPYLFASFPPRVNEAEDVVVKARIRNTTTVTEKVRVNWIVSKWDAQLRENVVHEYEEDVIVPAGGSTDTSVRVTDTSFPVYLATAKITWKDTYSIVNVRFARTGVERIRINFPGVLSYPLVAGQENTLFSCLHNSGGAPLVSGGSLELTLTDMQGKLIHSYTYVGDVSGSMMGVADSFVPAKNYDSFILNARLYQNDSFVDEAHLVYDCQLINPALCSSAKDSFSGDIVRNITQSGFAILIGLVLVLLLFRILRHSNPVRETF